MACDNVGNTNPDVGGIGIILSFALQAFISTLLSAWSFFYSYMLEYAMLEEHQELAYGKTRDIIDGILLSANDTQTLNGIALLISGLSQIKILDLYHLHILYDTVSFTGISNCAAMVCSFKTLKKHTGIRLVSVILLLVLFLTFSIAFGLKLNAWDESKPGHCYNASKISHGSAKHPYHDHLYLGFTVWAVVGALIWACGGCFDGDAQPTDPITVFFYKLAKFLPGNAGELAAVKMVLTYAFIQLPLHLYMVIALRATNQPLLEGDSENAWGFGQVISMVMVAATLSECWKGYREWRDWCHQTEDEADRNAISRASFNSDQGLDSPYTYDQSQTPSQPSLVPVAHQQSSSKDDLDVLEVISQNSLSGVREVFAIQYSTPELCR